QIVTHQTGHKLSLLRADHYRIGVVDHQSLDRWIQAQLPGERRAEKELIDDPGARLDELGMHQVFPFHRERPDWELEDAAADAPPRPNERRQGCDRTNSLTASLRLSIVLQCLWRQLTHLAISQVIVGAMKWTISLSYSTCLCTGRHFL